MSSTHSKQSDLSPLDFGWKQEEGCYRVQWFEGDASPKALDVTYGEDMLLEEHDQEGNL
jgi:hypothetical protein